MKETNNKNFQLKSPFRLRRHVLDSSFLLHNDFSNERFFMFNKSDAAGIKTVLSKDNARRRMGAGRRGGDKLLTYYHIDMSEKTTKEL